ncbi:MAG TPA: glycosyl hydrolase 53 family protein [Natronosporangium sp.]
MLTRSLLGRAFTALATGLLLTATFLSLPDPALAQATVVNPGFESGSGQTPTGWSESGQTSASYAEAGGRSGARRLAHWSASAYQVETYQQFPNLPSGSYTLRVWVRSSGGQHAAYIALRNCGVSPEPRTNIPQTSTTTWVQISVTANLSGGSQCRASFNSNANAGNWINFDDVELISNGGGGGQAVQIKGGDVSTLAKNEAFGGTYFDSAGNPVDPLVLLRDNGMNYARLKVWVNPADGFNNKARVLAMAQRIKALGMGLVIDFHYSDSWADPGQQNKPAAWRSLSFNQLRDAVYNHTFDVLNSLRAQGTTADIAQIGNEINAGMLWPDGSTDNWNNLAQLLTAGATAAKDVSSSTRVMLHLAEGGNNAQHRWWFDNATARGVPLDIIGVSHYIYWHGSLASLQQNLNDLASRYGRPVAVMETAYGFTLAQDDSTPNIFNSALQQAGGYPASPAGQAAALRDVFEVVAAVPNGRGLGVFYWEPTWTAVPGSGWDPTDPSSGNGWENQALFDYNSRALPAISVFGEF